jgi:hypothetical protein
MIRERLHATLPGLPIAFLLFAALGGLVYLLISGLGGRSAMWIVAESAAVLLNVLFFMGLFVVNPNEGRVLQLFGY